MRKRGLVSGFPVAGVPQVWWEFELWGYTGARMFGAKYFSLVHWFLKTQFHPGDRKQIPP
jgi:hypothetical protein